MTETDNDTVWLSREAHDRLVAELEHLKGQGRAEASEAIERAREHGDISENAEYEVAKEEQGKLEARIREIERTLAHAVVGDTEAGDTVSLGNLVTIVDEDGDEHQVVLADREDKAAGRTNVSPQSPLGRALLGRQRDETVRYQAPAGELEVTITAIDTP